ncbi:MAG: hypothetical protein IK080_05695 [Clostridia bacterium]|nr:hypothetical protein [Clostridia bacterium]
MKKLLAICALILCAALVFVNFAAVASAAPSPEASTYTTRSGRGGGEEDTTTGGGGEPGSPGDSGRTTKNVMPTQLDNNGADDPFSPNYTGDREVSSDQSSTSPDMAADQPHLAALAATGLLMAAAVCAVAVTKKKSAEEN